MPAEEEQALLIWTGLSWSPTEDVPKANFTLSHIKDDPENRVSRGQCLFHRSKFNPLCTIRHDPFVALLICSFTKHTVSLLKTVCNVIYDLEDVSLHS